MILGIYTLPLSGECLSYDVKLLRTHSCILQQICVIHGAQIGLKRALTPGSPTSGHGRRQGLGGQTAPPSLRAVRDTNAPLPGRLSSSERVGHAVSVGGSRVLRVHVATLFDER